MGKRFHGICNSLRVFAKNDRKSTRRLLLSFISLLLASVTVVTMTFSWFSIKTSTLNANNFVLDCGKGLRVNDSGTSELSFSQTNKYLIPASSVDGRNLYFPTDGSDFSKSTELMTFRSANAGDKNQNFIQIDFSLTAQQNHTALYIDEENTSIMVRPQGSSSDSEWSVAQAAALRSALWSSTEEDGVPNTPIVFNPTISAMYTAAVADVDRSTGAFVASGRQEAHPFSDYSFGGEPVATLAKNVVTNFKYIIWLEGTDPKCTDSIREKDIQVKLAFTTSWDKTKTIRFEDATTNSWIDTKINNGYTLNLRYYEELNQSGQPTGVYSDFSMYRYNDSGSNPVKQWSCNIPDDMRRYIVFILRPSGGTGASYMFSYDSNDSQNIQRSFDRGANRLYVAKDMVGGENDVDTIDNIEFVKCKGYWQPIGDSDGAGHDSGDFDGDDF